MSKPIPPVRKYMTTSPHSVGSDQTVEKASELMSKHKIRHLPVLDGGKLVGLVSDRDVAMFQSLSGVDPAHDTITDIVDRDVYTVAPDTLLDVVCSEMAERKLGSAVVIDNKKVVGIFTSVDAMRALSELLHSRLA